MISREKIQSLIERPAGERPILSVYLDVSVNSDNKRTHRVFLSKERRRHQELDSDRSPHHTEALGEAFGRIERWFEEQFDESKKGVAFFVEIGGEWMDVGECALPLPNRVSIGPRPLVGPLMQVLASYDHHGVLLVDREHLRMVSFYMDQPVHQHEVDTEPYPAPRDVQRGGFSVNDQQKRKDEEVRHFFKDFALEVREFVRRFRPDDLILVGTDKNVQRFLEFLPAAVQEMVIHTDHARVDATVPEILDRLRPFFDRLRQEQTSAAVGLLRERVVQNHRATSGFHRTLRELQEGKVETLVLGRGVERLGGRCQQCGFLLVRRDSPCPYCGGDVRNGVELAEEMVRLAAEQEIGIEFVPADAVSDLDGVGALLRF